MGLEIILLSRQADKTFGKLGATLKDAGVGYSFQDLAIASIALTENRTIASNDRFLNTRQRFQRCELQGNFSAQPLFCLCA